MTSRQIEGIKSEIETTKKNIEQNNQLFQEFISSFNSLRDTICGIEVEEEDEGEMEIEE